jgi:hypothetical protein
MKRILLLTVLSLAVPAASFANNVVDFSNRGTISGSSSGLTLSSTLVAVNGLNGGGLISGHLGDVKFTTGALISGSLAMGGMFAAGGSLTVTGNGTDGIPKGTLFTGTFSGPVTWTLLTAANGTHNYDLTGSVTGELEGKAHVGAIVQLTANTGRDFFTGHAIGSSGNTVLAPIPEPASLSLLGTGIIALAGLARRKRKI